MFCAKSSDDAIIKCLIYVQWFFEYNLFSFWISSNVFFAESYFSINSRHGNTLTTNTVTCGILLGAGDMIQQRLEKAMGKKTDAHTHFDGTRTGKDLN